MDSKEDSYYTIDQPSKGIFKDKGSKFLAFAYPVKDEVKIKEIIASLRKEYFDARHHCYSYRLGSDKLIYRANDDGEPSGTAGKPILGQIQSHDLTNILIVVVRYFGGTLLGTSGLIQAYKQASLDAISNAAISKRFVYSQYNLEFEYQDMNKVMKVVKDFELQIRNQRLALACNFSVLIKLSQVDTVVSKLSSIEGLQYKYVGNE